MSVARIPVLLDRIADLEARLEDERARHAAETEQLRVRLAEQRAVLAIVRTALEAATREEAPAP